jgi:AraC-like DNA-binding protein
VTLLRLSSDTARINRDRAMIGRGDPEWLQVMVQTGGRHIVSQDGRSAPVVRGDVIAWQSTSPYRIDVTQRWSGMILICPLSLFGPRCDRAVRQTAVRFDSSSGPALLLRHYLMTLYVQAAHTAVRGSEVALGEAALDLVRALVLRPEPRATRPSPRLLDDVLEYIESHLGEAGLSAASIAKAHFVSRSQLDRVFKSHGTTVAQWIRHRQLEHCRRELLDPSHDHESIFTIALRWGFLNQPHFSRAFRATYGQTATEMRQIGKRDATYRQVADTTSH